MAVRVLFLVLSVCLQGFAQDGQKEPYDSQKVTVPFPTAQEALAKMEMPPGFTVTVFAAEPNLRQPIGFTIDERGRLWVVENDTYAESKLNFDTDLRDRILILEDADNDGVHDKRTVFWDQGVKMTSVEVGFGGVYVLAPPKLMFIPDANRDDVPDGPPQVLLDGFDHDAIRHNLANGLMWGPDGWLYGRHGIQATSLVGKPGATQSQRTKVTCGIWRFHPTRKEFQVVASGGTNPWGMDFDRHGEIFMINTVIGHLWHVVPGAYYRRMYGSHFNPYVYQIVEQTADHFHWDTGDEQWHDAKKGALTSGTDRAGGGHAHCGFMIYQGTNWPNSFRDKAYTFNFHGRRMNCDTLVREGNGYTGKHAPDLFRTEDEWFRGIELKSGPDGAVYALDWSDIGECHENDGVHRSSGRIYKLMNGAPTKALPELSGIGLAKLSNEQLVKLQFQDNVWHERTARRILMERAVAGEDMADVIRALTESEQERTPEHELRAMWTAYCIGFQDEEWLLSCLNKADEHLQSWAVRLLCDRNGELSENVIQSFGHMSENEKSGLLRLYLASAMQRMPLEDRFDVATDLVHYAEDANDRTQPLMIWYGIEPAVTEHPKKAMQLAITSKIPLVSQFIARRLAAEYLTPSKLEPLVAVLSTATVDQQSTLLVGMADGLKGVRKASPPAGWTDYAKAASKVLKTANAVREIGVVFGDGRALDDVRAIATNKQAADDARIEAIQVLASARPDDLFEVLKPMMNDRVAAGAAVRAMAASNHKGVGGAVLRAYRRLSPDDQAAAIDTLVTRVANAKVLLKAVADGRIQRIAVTAFHARQIRSLGDEGLNKQLTKVWGDVRESSADRKAAMAKIESLFTEQDWVPDVKAGQALFKKNCASCHVMFGEGGNIGPDLTGSNRKNLQYLLENIIDPSASVATSFRASILLLEDGRTLNGVVVEEDDRVLTLQTAKEKVRISKSDVDERKQTQQSLMPDGLLKELSDKQIVDLISFLQSR